MLHSISLPDLSAHALSGKLVRQVQSHPFRLIMTIGAAAFSVIDWAVEPPASEFDATFGLIYIALLSLVFFIPRTASVGLLLMELVVCFAPVQGGPSRFWGTYFAIGILAYEVHSAIFITGPIGFSVIVQCAQIAGGDDYSFGAIDVGASLAMCCTAAMIGYGFRWRSDLDSKRIEQNRLQLLEQQNAFLLRNSVQATKIHDSVAQKLTGMRLIAQRGIRRSTDRDDYHDDCEDWHEIDALSQQGLEEVRSIIDMMLENPPDNKSAQAADSSWMQVIKKTLESGDKRLRKQGFEGSGEIMDIGFSADGVTRDIRDAVTSLLGELYTNIAKHGDKDGDYQVSVTLQNRQVEIVQINQVKPSSTTEADCGKGMLAYTRNIALLGGVVETELDNDTWVVYARIPLCNDSRNEKSGTAESMGAEGSN
jgi:signal transduction histidine kinase